tara:strand:- start:695 stop:1036 length:342 start_codon:yes stop_codon:yes gene_type:complete
MSTGEHEEISIGDLVKLKDDEHTAVGFGIVIDVRTDTYDMAVALIENFNDYMSAVDEAFIPEEITEAEKQLLQTPVYLILWHSTDGHTFSSRPIWMYRSEITVISKVRTRDGN